MGVKRSVTKRQEDAGLQVRDLIANTEFSMGVGFGPQPKRKPGKHTFSDAELIGRRGPWNHLLESFWGKVGWKLKRARKPEDVRDAFQPFASMGSQHLLSPFLRPTSESTTDKSRLDSKKQHHESLCRVSELERCQNAQIEIVRQAEGAVSELSDENLPHLHAEIERRKKNLRDIGIRLSNKKGEMRKTELALKNAKPENCEALNVQLKNQNFEYQKIENERTDEQRILEQIKERIGTITPQRREVATKILEERKTTLATMGEELSEARKKWKQLEERSLDQEANYCRVELLKFIRSKRYSFNPRSVANALAGLPEMSCGRSAARCSKYQFSSEPGLYFKVFELVERTWRRGGSSKWQSPLPLFRQAIAKLPKTVIVEVEGRRRRMVSYFRRELEENWPYLKPAIEDGVRESKVPAQVPYLIAAKFQENQAKPKTQADLLFAEQEKLDLIPERRSKRL